ncbi:hypothetical protein BH11BAC6_BH11BAC6_10370 [soil metagenome]
MQLNFTYLVKKFLCFCHKNKTGIFLLVFVMLCNAQLVYGQGSDSAKATKPNIVTNLEQCRIPAFMITKVRHMSPVEIAGLNEEYQQTAINDEGEEIMIIVRLRFMEDHISGYIKEAPVNNTNMGQTISYIDIPVEWMCIQPKQDHPFHFATSIYRLDAIKKENGCLGWQQRDSEPVIVYAKEKPKRKSKNTKL